VIRSARPWLAGRHHRRCTCAGRAVMARRPGLNGTRSPPVSRAPGSPGTSRAGRSSVQTSTPPSGSLPSARRRLRRRLCGHAASTTSGSWATVRSIFVSWRAFDRPRLSCATEPRCRVRRSPRGARRRSRTGSSSFQREARSTCTSGCRTGNHGRPPPSSRTRRCAGEGSASSSTRLPALPGGADIPHTELRLGARTEACRWPIHGRCVHGHRDGARQ
jgi:hypothetical protein